MVFQECLNLFNSSRKKTFFQTHFSDLLIKWRLEDFPIILKKTTFISYLENSTNFKFNPLMINDINQAIEHLRYWFLETDQVIKRYILELDDEKVMKNYYLDFLMNSYSLIQEFIENILIVWIFEVMLGINHQEKNKKYNSDLYFKSQQEFLLLKFQQNVYKILKIVMRKKEHDCVFALLNQTYIQKINEKKELIALLKTQAEK